MRIFHALDDEKWQINESLIKLFRNKIVKTADFEKHE